MTIHTPGPWNLPIEMFGDYAISYEQAAADKRVADAAPDLLAALELYVYHADGWSTDPALAAARAAIAKARGV